MKLKRAGCYLTLGTSLVFILIMVIVGCVGFLGALGWNKAAQQTQCVVVDYSSYGHNCYVLDDYVACWDVYVAVTYETKRGNQLATSVQVEDDEYNELDALEQIAAEYPLNQSLRCWYNSGNESDVRFELESEVTYIVVLSVLGALFILCVVGDLYCCCERPKEDPTVIEFQARDGSTGHDLSSTESSANPDPPSESSPISSESSPISV